MEKMVLTSASSSATTVSTSTIAATAAAATVPGHLDQAGINLLLSLGENRN
jgi:hypothetical protein